MKQVSVIVPAWRAEKCLGDCLDSLLAQSADIEVLAVDDGSDDRTGAIIDEYAARRPDVVRAFHKPNGGQGSARNLALGAAGGEYVGFADADDTVEPDMFAQLYAAAKKADADIAVCNALGHCASGTQVIELCGFTSPLLMAGSVWNKIYRRALVGELRFPERRLWYEDLEFSAELAMLAKNSVTVPRPLYHYNQFDESTIRNRNARKNLDIIAIFDGIFAYADARGLSAAMALPLQALVADHILVQSVGRVAVMDSPERAAVIDELVAYARRRCPELSGEALKLLPKNSSVIAKLNYRGGWKVSRALLGANAALRGKAKQ